MQTALPFALGYLLPATCAVGLFLGGPWAWFTVLFAFVLTPALDALIPADRSQPEESPSRLAARWTDSLLIAWLPVQLALFVWTVDLVGSGRPYEQLGWVLSLGITAGGGGITVAHELMHRPDRTSRALAELLMALVLYPHFCVEHLLGHHRNVATPLDPASARLGESVWRFLPRTVGGGLLEAWRLETERVRSRRLGRLEDRRLRHPLLLLALLAGTGLLGGRVGLLVLLGQAAIAVLLLEVINYVEHYGLERRRLASGRYERTQPEHAWNSAHRLTGYYLFRLPRHSDHHYEASRPFPLLRHHEGAPQLPAGYPTMVLLALVPPLWRRVMDPRAEAWRSLGQPSSAAHDQQRSNVTGLGS